VYKGVLTVSKLEVAVDTVSHKSKQGTKEFIAIGLLNKRTDGKSSNYIFAIEPDSSQNTEFKDINDNHVGININSLTSVRSQQAGFYDDNLTRTVSSTTCSSSAARKCMYGWTMMQRNTRISVILAP
jgi:hypothetical protein